MSVNNQLNSTDKSELLRYFLGTPPYIQDNRFRELAERFLATDERPAHDDVRYNVTAEETATKEAAEDEKTTTKTNK